MAPTTTSHELTSALHAVTTPVTGIMCPSAKGISKELNPLQTEPSHHVCPKSPYGPRANTSYRVGPQLQAAGGPVIGRPPVVTAGYASSGISGAPSEAWSLQRLPFHHFNNRSCLAPRETRPCETLHRRKRQPLQHLAASRANLPEPSPQLPQSAQLAHPRKRGLPIPLSPSADKSNHRWPHAQKVQCPLTPVKQPLDRKNRYQSWSTPDASPQD